MLFMYWTGAEDDRPSSVNAWRDLYENFRVFTDGDVIPLLPNSFRSQYERIRLPAAKSDLARLLLLREYGGLYLDAHVGPTSPSFFLETLDPLFSHNVILFGKGWAMQSETDFDLMNGVLAARRKAPELDIVIDLIISNILKQEIRESETSAHVPYSLFGMTGTYTFVQSFFDQSPPRPRLKKEFESTIFVHYMKDNRKSGFALAEYYTYRRPGNHWSEREKNERFFLDSPALAVHSNPCAISTSSGHGLARAESAMLAETLPPRDAPPCSASDLSFQGVVDELSAPPCATPNALESDGNTDTNSATSSDLLRPEAERDQMQMSDDGRGNPQARIRQLETMSLPTNTPTCPDGQPHEWEAGTTLIFYCKRCTQLKQVLPYSLVFD